MVKCMFALVFVAIGVVSFQANAKDNDVRNIQDVQDVRIIQDVRNIQDVRDVQDVRIIEDKSNEKRSSSFFSPEFVEDESNKKKPLLFFHSSEFVRIEHPKTYGSVGYNGAPEKTNDMNHREVDYSRSYWEKRYKIGVAYELVDNIPLEIFYTRFHGEFSSSNTFELVGDEWSNVYSLRHGNPIGNIGTARGSTVESKFDFDKKGETFGLNIKYKKGYKKGFFTTGLGYSYTEITADSDFAQTGTISTMSTTTAVAANIPNSHDLNERIETKRNRISFLLGYTFQPTDNLSLSIEGDFGYSYARNAYDAKQSGYVDWAPEYRDDGSFVAAGSNSRGAISFQESHRVSDDRNFYSPEFKAKLCYKFGKLKIVPYGLIRYGEIPKIHYHIPKAGGIAFANLPGSELRGNRGATLDHESYKSLGCGIQFEIRW